MEQMLTQLTGASAGRPVPQIAQALLLEGHERGLSATGYGSLEASARRLLQPLEQLRLAMGGDADGGRPTGEAVQDRLNPGAIRWFDTLNQPPAPEGHPRDADLLAALAGLRQVAGTQKPATQVIPSALDSMSAVPAQGSVHSAAAGTQAVPTLSLDVPLHQADWDRALGERIQWLMGRRIQGAQIKLNPAHLGPLEVRIQIQNDQASIQFVSTHAAVREALEAALPRLRDMFDSAGVGLLNVDVSGESFAQQRHASDEPVSAALNHVAGTPEEGPERLLETAVADMLVSGRLDLFV
jgi:flagellar hook-length control protein FliK